MKTPLAVARASAPGKVNLLLRVCAPDEHGYHPLFTVFETLNSREHVHAALYKNTADPVPTTKRKPTGPIITVTNRVKLDPHPDTAAEAALNQLDPSQHLAWRAAATIMQAGTSPRCRALRNGKIQMALTVVKRIPVAGGMAGGSADAAAALIATNEILQAGLSATELIEVGRTLGADVPACLTGGISVARGYGDRIIQNLNGGPHHWVMLTAHEGLSTPAVFREYDRVNPNQSQPHGRVSKPLPHELTPLQERAFGGNATELASHLSNDLQAVALQLRTDLRRTMKQLESTDAVAAVLSGSGPTIAVLARDPAHARKLAEKCAKWDSVAAAIITTGPAEPAKLEALPPQEDN